jgi:hypothetical protein
MKGTMIKLAIALLTFGVGVGVAYSVWILRSDPQIDPVATPAREPPTPSAEFARGGRATTIEEEWESVKTADICLNPMTDLLDSFPSLKRDEPRAVAFLISHIPDRERTNVHVAPLGMALRGEVAVYCLSQSLEMPWYKLKREYDEGLERVIAVNPGASQDYLQNIIKSRRRSKELMAAWGEYYAARRAANQAGGR